MSTTFTTPDGVDLEVHDEVVLSPADAHAMAGTRMTAWCESQGLDALTIPSSAFAITRAPDGVLTAHFRTFELGPGGNLVLALPATDEHAYRKHGWQTQVVTGLPTDFPAPSTTD